MDNTLIDKINTSLKSRRHCTVNIINDKLTLAVFSMLQKNLKNVRQINFIIRNPRSLPRNNEVFREFELSPKAQKSSVSHINFDSVIHHTMDKAQIQKATHTFNQIWNRPDFTEDYKDQILSSLKALYKEHAPEFLYYYDPS